MGWPLCCPFSRGTGFPPSLKAWGFLRRFW